MCICVRMHACVYVYIYVYIYMYICVCVCVRVCVGLKDEWSLEGLLCQENVGRAVMATLLPYKHHLHYKP